MGSKEHPQASILVVDDSATSRTWARLCLARAGYRVLEAESAREALATISQEPPDLVLLDVILPDRDGYSVTRELREDPTFTAIPIILLTSLEDLTSKVKGLRAGANDFLTKPPDEAELLARVRTLLRLKRSREDLLAEKAKTELLYRVSRELGAELDMDTLLARILDLTLASIGASGGSIILLNERGLAIRNIFSHRGEVATIREDVWGQVMEKGLAAWVIQHKDAIILSDAQQDPRWVIGETVHFETRSVMAVPLIHEGRVAGVLTLSNEEVDKFDLAQLDLLRSIAAQAAVVIDKARLFDDVEHERSRLKAILTGTRDVIVATDKEWHITLLNPAAEQAFGISFGEAAGRPLDEVLPYPALVEAFQRIRGEDRYGSLAELSLSDGKTLFFNVSPVAGPKGEGGWVAVMQDITYLKELEQMKNEFVATVSHDLRSPLTTIRGYADLLLRTADGQDQEFIQYIKTGAEQMAELIEDLLGLGKIEAGVETIRIPSQLEELAHEVLEAASFQAQLRQIELVTDFPESLRPVLADPRQLRQVLDNIISNALKYTSAGGRVGVRVWEQDGRVLVEVEDSGIGIPTELFPRLFEKFYRVPRPETDMIPGSGLGLSIVKAILDQHEGQIWVESVLGQGSKFVFSLPQA